MMKKALIWLLVLALAAPMAMMPAKAAKYGSKLPEAYTLKIGSTSYKLVNYDIPIYTMNESLETQDVEGNKFVKTGQTMIGANEDNYNAKLIWNSADENPTLILRGFVFDEWNNDTGLMEAGKWDAENNKYKPLQTYSITTGKTAPLDIILTGEDSFIETKFGITYYNDTTITSDGTTKLTMNNESSCIAPNQSTGNLTIDANLDLTLRDFYNTQYAAAVIHTYGGTLTVNGGILNLTCDPSETKTLIALHARNGADLIINGGVINATSIVGAARNNGCLKAEGKLIINGGYVTAAPRAALGLHGREGIQMNGGIVNTTAKLWAISFGANKDDPGQFVFNGGTLTATSKYVFHSECTDIKLGEGVVAYAGTGETDAEVQGEDVTKYYTKSWVRLTNNPKHAPGWDGKDDAPATTPTTKPTIPPTTKPTTAPTTEPTTAPTAAPTKAPTTAPASAPTKVTTPATRVTQGHMTLPSKTTQATTPGQETAATAVTEITQATQMPEVTELTSVTEATQAPEVTEATTQTPAPTEKPQATKGTVATQPEKDKDVDKANEKSPNVILIVAIVVVALAGTGTAAYFLVIKKKKG